MDLGSSEYRWILDQMSVGMFFVDLERRITYWNRAAEEISGYTAGEMVGERCPNTLLMHVDEEHQRLCEKGCPLISALEEGLICDVDAYLLHRRGHRIPARVRVMPVRDSEGKMIGAIQVFSDISSQVEALRKIETLEEIALLDPLTGLGNRRYTEMCIRDRVAEHERYGRPFGVLFIDVDELKNVNDRFGHALGDEMLTMVSKTLLSNTRANDFIGRWGGDEFVVVVTAAEEASLAAIAERFRLLVEQSSLKVGSQDHRVTVSMGVTVSRPGDTAETIVQRADSLMYQSKAAGRNHLTRDFSVA
jgi:diguanylate cyclase (GGDEF)-like protein/PAS domain S-box-containing protein